jgi:hypothetical protein
MTAEGIGKIVGKLVGLIVPAVGAFTVIKPILGVISGIAGVVGGAIKGIGGLAKVFGTLGAKGSLAAIGIGLLTAKIVQMRLKFPDLKKDMVDLSGNVDKYVGKMTVFEQMTAGVMSSSQGQVNSLNTSYDAVANTMEVIIVNLGRMEAQALQATSAMTKTLDVATKVALQYAKNLRLQHMIDTGAPVAPVTGIGGVTPAETAAIQEESDRLQKERKVWAEVARETIEATQLRVKKADAAAASVRRWMGVSDDLAKFDAKKAEREEERRRKRCLNVSSKLSVDGSEMTVAESRAKLEITERGGAGLTPWQRRQVVERGAVQAAVTRG